MPFDWVVTLVPFAVGVTVLMVLLAAVSPQARELMLLGGDAAQPDPQDPAGFTSWVAEEVDRVWA